MAGADDRDDNTTRTDLAGGRIGGEPAGPAAVLPWLSTAKASVPDRVVGYLDRLALLERVLPTRRRATVLVAPGGFGKTVLMSESCRELRDAGVMAAWLTLDGQDAPQTLNAYLAYAFQVAGLILLDVPGTDRDGGGDLRHRTGLLSRALEQHGAPCVLALDQLEQLDDPGSLALLNFLINWGPANLHVVIACREIPAALDIASPVLAGRAGMFTTDDLRFSKPDIARFFGPGLRRREIAWWYEETSGWAIAMRILRNEGRGGTGARADGTRHAADSWVESRLWRGLPGPDRALLLDVGLFEWIDAALLDEVLEEGDAMRRVEAIPAVAGLLESVGGGTSDALRLHPLIREHCGRRLFREAPERFRWIHRRIAGALARRGETVAAMRHASEAGDAALVGEILENAGGLRLWLREGLVRLQAVDRFVTGEVMERFPRAALSRCIVLLFTGGLDEARRTYRALAAGRRPVAEVDIEYELDDTVVRGMLCLFGCDGCGSEGVRAVLAEHERFAEMEGVDPLIRAVLGHGDCLVHNLKAEFDAALGWAERAGRCVPDSLYLGVLLDLQRGQIAMARGRVREAVGHYGGALATARAHFLHDSGPGAFGEALVSELNLERNRVAGIRDALQIPRGLLRGGTPFASYAARAGIVLDLTLWRGGVDEALAAVSGMRDYARAARLPMIERYLAAERVSLLAVGGRAKEAEDAWRLDGLPERAEGCLDLESQGWRELEALACARLRLLTARGEFEAGRAFLRDLVAVASGRDLRRTWMRALALGIALERTAGRPAEAERHLTRFLGLFGESDYARPLVRERETCAPALEEWLGSNPDDPAADAAGRLLRMLDDGGWPERAIAMLSPRALDVLRRLETQSDREIAATLGLTKAGVRYHIGNVFRKLGVRDRARAVRRAREIGLLP